MPGPRGVPGARKGSAVWAIVLAAGGSTRMGDGRLKQLLRLGDETLVRRATRTALASRCRETVVVVGCRSDRVGAEVADLPCRVVVNAAWREGQAGSVRTGLAELSKRARAAIFLPCDQPAVDARLLDRLIATFERTSAQAVYPTHEGRPGSPTLISRALFDELENLVGDTGGRAILGRHRERAVAVELEDPAALLDIDTEPAWRLLVGGRPGSGRR